MLSLAFITSGQLPQARAACFLSQLWKCMQSIPSRDCRPTSDSSSQIVDVHSTMKPALHYLFILSVVPNELKSLSWNTDCNNNEGEEPFYPAFYRVEWVVDDKLFVIVSFHLFPSFGSLIIFPLLVDFPSFFLAFCPCLLSPQIIVTLTFFLY